MRLRAPWLLILILSIVAIVGVVSWLSQLGGHDEPPPKSGPIVVVPDSQIRKPRPEHTTLPRSIGTHQVPVARRVTAGTPDSALAARYAKLASDFARWRIQAAEAEKARARGDTAAADSLPPRPLAILPPVAGKYDGRTLALYLTRSDGSVLEATARLRPHWEFSAGQGGTSDSIPRMREDRWWLRQVREIPKCGAIGVAAAAVGAVLDKRDRAGGALKLGLGGVIACLAD